MHVQRLTAEAVLALIPLEPIISDCDSFEEQERTKGRKIEYRACSKVTEGKKYWVGKIWEEKFLVGRSRSEIGIVP